MNARILLVTGSLVLSVLIGSVIARRSGGDAPARTGSSKPRIGLSLDTLKEERWQRDRDRFVAAAEKLGAEVLVQAANGDDTTQAKDVTSLLSSGIDVLVIVPHDAAAMAASVDKARAANVPVISYDRLITNSDVTLYLSFDNEKVGEEQAKYLVSKLPGGKGKIVRIYGSPTDNNARLFKAGQDRVIQPLVDSGAVTVVHEDWAQDWKPENAKKIMNAAITGCRARQQRRHSGRCHPGAHGGGARGEGRRHWPGCRAGRLPAHHARHSVDDYLQASVRAGGLRCGSRCEAGPPRPAARHHYGE